MEFLIITGLSGAGKSRAADVLEDLDYYCVDNMPTALITRFAELCIATAGRYEKVALVVDVRERAGFEGLLPVIDELREMNCGCRILYMDADIKTLVRRYKESRRPHPLQKRGVGVEEAVARENELLAPVKERADYIVNSSALTLGMLQNRLYRLFAPSGGEKTLDITVMSFGYKHGIPLEADLVFDVRFLPNPFYVEELRVHTGLEKAVSDYVFSFPQTGEFLQGLEKMFDFLIPYYIEEGKLGLTVAVGCTGGHHRSVAMAEALSGYFSTKGYSCVSVNRDIEK